MLCYVYAVVPIALCRSEGCGISTSENGGVKTEIEEDYAYRPVVSDVGSITNTRGVIANPSIGEVKNKILKIKLLFVEKSTLLNNLIFCSSR